MSEQPAPLRLSGTARGLRCPNCKTPMLYIEFFDGHRCPDCITIIKPAAPKEETRDA